MGCTKINASLRMMPFLQVIPDYLCSWYILKRGKNKHLRMYMRTFVKLSHFPDLPWNSIMSNSIGLKWLLHVSMTDTVKCPSCWDNFSCFSLISPPIPLTLIKVVSFSGFSDNLSYLHFSLNLLLIHALVCPSLGNSTSLNICGDCWKQGCLSRRSHRWRQARCQWARAVCTYACVCRVSGIDWGMNYAWIYP